MVSQSEAAPLPGGKSGPPRRESIHLHLRAHPFQHISSSPFAFPCLLRNLLSLFRTLSLPQTISSISLDRLLLPSLLSLSCLVCIYISCQTNYTLLHRAYRSRSHPYGTDLFVLLQARSPLVPLVLFAVLIFFLFSKTILSGRQLLGTRVLGVTTPESKVSSATSLLPDGRHPRPSGIACRVLHTRRFCHCFCSFKLPIPMQCGPGASESGP